MDPISLTGVAITFLVSYAKAKWDKSAEIEDKNAFDKGKNTFNILESRFEGNKLERLRRFEKQPETYRADLEDILKAELENNKELLDELENSLKKKGPIVEISVEEAEAEGGKGGKVGIVKKGYVKANVKIEGKAKDYIGFEIDQIGDD